MGKKNKKHGKGQGGGGGGGFGRGGGGGYGGGGGFGWGGGGGGGGGYGWGGGGRGGGGGGRGPFRPNFKNKDKKPYNRPGKPTRGPLNIKNVLRAGWRTRQLVQLYPEFEKFTTKIGENEYKVDFKDKASICALTKYTLKRDFQLEVEFPTNLFVPNISFRIEMIIMVDDLLTFLKTNNLYSSDTYNGLDLVNGSSCVYSLVAAKMNPTWNILATEIGNQSQTFGSLNIKNNSLEERVNVKEVKDGDPLLNGVLNADIVYDFCMYTPTYFVSKDGKVAMGKKQDSKGNWNFVHPSEFDQVIKDQLKANGEFEYINFLINESKEFKDKVRLFCVQVGRRSTMARLWTQLKELVGDDYVTVIGCHDGPVTRYGIAWTFFPDMKIASCFDPKLLGDVKFNPKDDEEHEEEGKRKGDDDEEGKRKGDDEEEGKRKGDDEEEEGSPKKKPKLMETPGTQNAQTPAPTGTYLLQFVNTPKVADIDYCVERAVCLLNHLAVTYTKKKPNTDEFIFNLKANSVTWNNFKENVHDDEDFCEDGVILEEDDDFKDCSNIVDIAIKEENTAVKDSSGPVLTGDLSISKSPDDRIKMMLSNPSSETKSIHLESLWNFLVKCWNRHVLPNYPII